MYHIAMLQNNANLLTALPLWISRLISRIQELSTKFMFLSLSTMNEMRISSEDIQTC